MLWSCFFFVFCGGEEKDVGAWDQILSAAPASISASLRYHWGQCLSGPLCDRWLVTRCVIRQLSWFAAKAGYNGIKTALYLLRASNRAMYVRYVKQS